METVPLPCYTHVLILFLSGLLSLRHYLKLVSCTV